MNNACLICDKGTIEFSCQPCGCAILCRGCAMRMATGGKCRQCGKFFIECVRVQDSSLVQSDSSDSDGANGESDAGTDTDSCSGDDCAT